MLLNPADTIRLALALSLMGGALHASAAVGQASTGQSAATAQPAPDPEPRTNPCDETNEDDECWILPRGRSEVTEGMADSYEEGQAVRFDRDNEDIAFYYGYPKPLQAEKKLAAYLRKDADDLFSSYLDSGRDDRAKALKLGINPSKYEKIVIERQWSNTAKSKRLIGLIQDDGNVQVHEQVLESSYIWDRKLAKMIAFKSLFTDPKAALRLISRESCADLKQQWIERDRSAVEETKEPDFCPTLAYLPAPVLEDWKGDRRIDGFRVLAGHFRAYADGPFEGWAPVTPKLLALIKPQYRSDFAVSR